MSPGPNDTPNAPAIESDAVKPLNAAARPSSFSAVVILTGDLASLVACRIETLRRDRLRSAIGGAAAHDPHGHAASRAAKRSPILAWVPSFVTGPRRAAALAAAAWCQVDHTVEDPVLSDSPANTLITSPSTEAETAAILRACAAAIGTFSSPRVVWPAHIGIGGDAEPPQAFEHTAATLERAMLIWQLAEIDAEQHNRRQSQRISTSSSPKEAPSSQAPGIDLPCLDLSDRQLIELALDLGVPLNALHNSFRPAAGARRTGQALAWACQTIGVSHPCGVCAPCRRWESALASVIGPADSVAVVSAPKHKAK